MEGKRGRNSEFLYFLLQPTFPFRLRLVEAVTKLVVAYFRLLKSELKGSLQNGVEVQHGVSNASELGGSNQQTAVTDGGRV